jgi:hypothetical protein
MALLDHYLRAVRIYLPNTAEKADILVELSEHLRTKMDEREEELGRALTEVEQEDVLAQHGNPSVVAARYGSTNLGFAFGIQIIGPEVFPLYARILALQFTVAAIVVTAIDFYVEQRMGPWARYLVPFTFQFIVSTTIFASIDRFHRARRNAGDRTSWSFPPTYLQPIPRWQSIAGAVCLGITAAWWAAIPAVPALILFSAADRLELGPAFATFYWPLLLLLLVGFVQRLVTIVHPEWNWLQPITRLFTNGVAVLLVYPMMQAYPYVFAVDATNAASVALANRFNGSIWWNVFTGMGLYWLITAAFMAFMCAQHVAFEIRRRRSAPVRGLRQV